MPFCGQPSKFEGRKRGFDVIPVRTDNCTASIEEACHLREDAWSEEVQGKLAYASDLHAADAI